MRHVPEIKLIRTDTTLDLSQKAEKVCLPRGRGPAQVPRPAQPGVMGRAPGRGQLPAGGRPNATTPLSARIVAGQSRTHMRRN